MALIRRPRPVGLSKRETRALHDKIKRLEQSVQSATTILYDIKQNGAHILELLPGQTQKVDDFLKNHKQD